jgi:DNA-binding response OmpR family regulator
VKILIAEDEPVSRHLLEACLKKWGYDVMAACDGNEAWEICQKQGIPELAILDWMMPGMDGLELCRKIRAQVSSQAVYILILTAKGGQEDVVEGLKGGADDYVVKPFDPEELRARVQAGVRIIELQKNLTSRVRELEEALALVKRLQGLLPICVYCKKIRNDQNYWAQVEEYISRHSDAKFSHGICPDCYQEIVVPQIDNFHPH